MWFVVSKSKYNKLAKALPILGEAVKMSLSEKEDLKRKVGQLQEFVLLAGEYARYIKEVIPALILRDTTFESFINEGNVQLVINIPQTLYSAAQTNVEASEAMKHQVQKQLTELLK